MVGKGIAEKEGGRTAVALCSLWCNEPVEHFGGYEVTVLLVGLNGRACAWECQTALLGLLAQRSVNASWANSLGENVRVHTASLCQLEARSRGVI